MAHQWDRGVLNASSWHGLEEVGVYTDAASAIAHGERTGAWPVALRTEALRTACGLLAPCEALVADYEQHPARVVGCNGSRYRATATKEWRDLVTAAVAAGAKPTGTFSLAEGSRVLATFEVGQSNGVRTQFLLADSFDGSMKLKAGFTTIRVVCANTLAAAFGKDGAGMASLLHTATLETKVNVLAESIGEAIKTGDRVRDLYHQAEETRLSRAQAEQVFDLLFPRADPGESKMTIARADGVRRDARHAAAKAINHVDAKGATSLATLWNAATYLVDRNVDGSAKTYGESDNLKSLLFGTRGKRLEEVQKLIEVVMNDGTVELMTTTEAMDHGVDTKQIVRSVLDELMA
jgi:Domain of unknown function (DUF932)